MSRKLILFIRAVDAARSQLGGQSLIGETRETSDRHKGFSRWRLLMGLYVLNEIKRLKVEGLEERS